MNSSGDQMDRRDTFLLDMYKQMFADISQHITVVWQSVGTVVGAFAFLALAEKGIVPIDVGLSLIIALTVWLGANVIEAGYWYNRNLVIIANIERQFLVSQDTVDIQYYFSAHRPKNKMISMLKIQIILGGAIAGIVLLYHFSTRVLPGLSAPISNFEPSRGLPYITAIVAASLLWFLRCHRVVSYAEFVSNSPGISVSQVGVNYGVGHGYEFNRKDVWKKFFLR